MPVPETHMRSETLPTVPIRASHWQRYLPFIRPKFVLFGDFVDERVPYFDLNARILFDFT
jgi:hypothetical protein